jgi:uncharacterized protein YjbJ (UPF0337 family)
MGEMTDKLKGNLNKAVGAAKESSPDPAVRQEGAAQKSKGHGQELKGALKGVINKL